LLELTAEDLISLGVASVGHRRRLLGAIATRGAVDVPPPRSARRAREIAGQIEEALTVLDEALQIAERTGERWFAAELNRYKGELLLRQEHSEAAEELYDKALAIAAQQQVKLWELRAAMSLPGSAATRAARLKRATSSRRFMAGTPDLKDARARCSTSCDMEA
jgi:predicted ATPase